MQTQNKLIDLNPPATETPAGSVRESLAAPVISRREFVKLAGFGALGAGLAACAPRNPLSSATSPSKAQLVYQDWRTDWYPEMATKMIADFEEDHPSIQVFFSPDPEDLIQQMPVDFQAGTAPDILAGCCDWLADWAQQGYLLDLKPFVEADLDQATLDDWDPAQYSALFTPDGVQFALPKYHGALGLYYNKDIFDSFGVSYPNDQWTHEDYRLAMLRLTHDRDGDGKIDLWGSMMDIAWERIQVHVNAWGGHFVDPENPARSFMARPEALEAMQWIHDRMWRDHIMASFLDVQNMETRQAFLNGHTAMVEDGSWALKDILENAEFNLGVTSLPAGPVRKVTLATTDGFGIYAGTRHPEAAWEFIKYLVSKKYGRAMAQAHLLQPSRASLVDEWVELVQNNYPNKSNGLDIESFAEGHRQGYSVTAEIFSNMASARQLADDAWQQIFTLGQLPVDEMVRVSARIDLAQAR
jgi:multiple sugar transport system substrate-binding protein